MSNVPRQPPPPRGTFVANHQSNDNAGAGFTFVGRGPVVMLNCEAQGNGTWGAYFGPGDGLIAMGCKFGGPMSRKRP